MIKLDSISKKAATELKEMFLRFTGYKKTKNEKPEDIICPICGYYCKGNGGYFCIDKPVLCNINKISTREK